MPEAARAVAAEPVGVIFATGDAACEEAIAGGRAYRVRRVTIREHHAAPRQRVDVGRFVKGVIIVCADVRVAQVVGHNDEHIRALGRALLGSAAEEQESKQ